MSRRSEVVGHTWRTRRTFDEGGESRPLKTIRRAVNVDQGIVVLMINTCIWFDTRPTAPFFSIR